MRGWGTLLFAALVVVIVVALVLNNGQEVSVSLLVLEWRTKLWGAMVAGAVFGAAASALVLTWPVVRLNLQVRRQTKRIAELEQELHGLRTLPIAGESVGAQSVQKT